MRKDGKNKELQVSTIGMLILLLFNDETHAQQGITIEKIMNYLGLDEDTTMKNLLCLVNPKNKVLKIKRTGEQTKQVESAYSSMQDQSDAEGAQNQNQSKQS